MTASPEFGFSSDWVSLRELIARSGALSPETGLLVLRESLLGLGAAHEHGGVHLDCRPENVLVDRDGRSELTGFDSPEAADGPYQAPEVRDGGPVSPGGNLYAATAVFFECLTGLAPSPGRIRQFRRRELSVSGALGQAVEPLGELMAWGMAGNPARRPGSAMDFVAELDNVAGGVFGPDWHRRGRHDLADRVAAVLAGGTSARGRGPAQRSRGRSFYAGVAALVAVHRDDSRRQGLGGLLLLGAADRKRAYPVPDLRYAGHRVRCPGHGRRLVRQRNRIRDARRAQPGRRVVEHRCLLRLVQSVAGCRGHIWRHV